MKHKNLMLSLLLSIILTFTACSPVSTLPSDTPMPDDGQVMGDIDNTPAISDSPLVLDGNENHNTDNTGAGETEPNVPADGSEFYAAFIDVGQGDASLIYCDGEYMLIDGGDTSASSTMYTYFKDRNIDTVKVMVATHRDADHVGGLAGMLNFAKAETAYCSTTSHTSKAFQNMVKYLEAGGTELEVPNVGDTFYIGSAKVTILGPVKEYDGPNNNSIVLRVDYGNTSFLFTGDMEQAAETDLLDAGTNIKADVLKVGHHGSSTSTGYRLLREVQPTYAVISCGVDNSYGHPHDETLSKLRDAEVTVYRTDVQGDITCHSDGTTLTWETQKAASQSELNPTTTDGSGQMSNATTNTTYIGNLNSQVFHKLSCKSLPKESNRIVFNNREDAVNAVYRPCGTCKP